MSALPSVCFLTGTLNAFAGAERMTAVIANALAERGYRVFVLSLWDRASVFPLHEGVTHEALFAQRPSFKRAYASTVLGIRRFVRKHGIDVLVEVDTMLTLFTLPATLGMNVRRIAWEHCHFDEDLGRKARRVARWLAGRFDDGVVVLTERDRQRWKSALAPRTPVVAIPNALPFPFPPHPHSGGYRTVLAAGRLVKVKGFDVLIDAWKMVSTVYPDWKLVIAGEGEERVALETRIDRLKLNLSVTLVGVQTRMGDLYTSADIFCLSSFYEGFSLVLIEAMSFGLPVVSTACETGPREIIQNGTNGILVPTGSAPALADALMKLISDVSLAQRLGWVARDSARQWTSQAVVSHWCDLLQHVVSKSAPKNFPGISM